MSDVLLFMSASRALTSVVQAVMWAIVLVLAYMAIFRDKWNNDNNEGDE